MVASYETSDTRLATTSKGSTVDSEIMEHLEALGYIDGSSSPDSERNLAALHFEAGRFENAAEIYARLVEKNPEDGTLRTSLAGALGALGRFDEAVEHLKQAIAAQPLNAEAYHNLAVIQERRGNREGAVEQYRTVLRYNPQYEPSRRALIRLTGSAQARVLRDEADRRAWELAEEAGQAARRGDYAEATKLLDEAENISPRNVVVHQHRSNVAYLKGDTASAVAALEKALEIEPDNALFKTNLRRLKQQAEKANKP
jgi:tetratricopeptide (TPR) repeat protein